MRIPPMVDMRVGDGDGESDVIGGMDGYPYGLRISLCNDEIEKIDLDDCKKDDTFVFKAKAVVKSITDQRFEDGTEHKRYELQIVAIKPVSTGPDGDNDEDDRRSEHSHELRREELGRCPAVDREGCRRDACDG